MTNENGWQAKVGEGESYLIRSISASPLIREASTHEI